MDNSISLIGYHGTCDKHIDNILKDGFICDTITEGHWLGQGYYFFTEVDIALSWATDQVKKKKNKGSKETVIKVEILVEREKFLNLNSPKQLNDFINYISAVFFSEHQGFEAHADFTSNRQMFRIFLDYYKNERGIKVVKKIFSKKNPRYISYDIQYDKFSETLKDCGFGIYGEEQICVTDNEYILSKHIMK